MESIPERVVYEETTGSCPNCKEVRTLLRVGNGPWHCAVCQKVGATPNITGDMVKRTTLYKIVGVNGQGSL